MRFQAFSFDLGPVHMEVGTLRQVRSPALVGQPIYPYSLSFLLDRVHMLGEVPHERGLPGQPVQVTRFGGVSFLSMWKLRSGITCLTGVIIERGELFRRFHLQNRQNAVEINSAGDN